MKICTSPGGYNKEASKLAKALSKFGSVILNTQEKLSYLSPHIQTAIFIYKLLSQIDNETLRIKSAIQVLKNAKPLPFAHECFYWMRYEDKERNANKIFTTEEEKKLSLVLIDKIKESAQKKPLYIEYGRHSKGLLWDWKEWGDSNELKEYLIKTFDENTNNIISFLMIFTPIAVGVDGSISAGQLRLETFEEITKLIEPSIIYTKLLIIYGKDLDQAEKAWHYEVQNIDDNKKLAMQFAAHYNVMVKEKANDSKSISNKNDANKKKTNNGSK